MNKYGLFSALIFSFWHADCFNVNKINTKPSKRTLFNHNSIFTPGSSRRSAALHIKNLMKGGDGKEDRRQERRTQQQAGLLETLNPNFQRKAKPRATAGRKADGSANPLWTAGLPLGKVKPNFNFLGGKVL